MVEEYSATINTHLDSDYSPSNAAHLAPSTKCKDIPAEVDLVLNVAPIPKSTNGDDGAFPFNVAEEKISDDEICDASKREVKNTNYRKTGPVESKRSKSLCNAGSTEVADESKSKRDVKKSQSNPIKTDNQNEDVGVKVGDEREAGVDSGDKCSPAANVSSADALDGARLESPKPGCSQQDCGEHVFHFDFYSKKSNVSCNI